MRNKYNHYILGTSIQGTFHLHHEGLQIEHHVSHHNIFLRLTNIPGYPLNKFWSLLPYILTMFQRVYNYPHGMKISIRLYYKLPNPTSLFYLHNTPHQHHCLYNSNSNYDPVMFLRYLPTLIKHQNNTYKIDGIGFLLNMKTVLSHIDIDIRCVSHTHFTSPCNICTLWDAGYYPLLPNHNSFIRLLEFSAQHIYPNPEKSVLKSVIHRDLLNFPSSISFKDLRSYYLKQEQSYLIQSILLCNDLLLPELNLLESYGLTSHKYLDLTTQLDESLLYKKPELLISLTQF